ncbi:MAG: IS66 family insertion sequence element accessory protein TnpB [Gammaproteobacteria bacterium]|nr:IS66 family insertion sequence element accessory protein TnpB [Gammaproteobacteria bacterium]
MAARQGADYWRGHVQGWRQSGLSQIAYCERHALNIKSFCRWRRKQQATAAATPSLTLVPASVTAPVPGNVIRLHSPGGWQIELPAGEAPWLADLLRSLP